MDHANAGDEVVIVLDRTTLYAESGGQVGDTGVIGSVDTAVDVINTTKNHNGIFLHQAKVKAGMISCGESVSVQVDSVRRRSSMRSIPRHIFCRRPCAVCWVPMWSRLASW